MIYLDTHAAVWMHQGKFDWLSKPAIRAIEQEADIRVSPMVVLELHMLKEQSRVRFSVDEILKDLLGGFGARVCNLPFELIARKAFDVTWTHDPWDRLIVAHALASEAHLLTRDRLILKHYPRAFC